MTTHSSTLPCFIFPSLLLAFLTPFLSLSTKDSSSRIHSSSLLKSTSHSTFVITLNQTVTSRDIILFSVLLPPPPVFFLLLLVSCGGERGRDPVTRASKLTVSPQAVAPYWGDRRAAPGVQSLDHAAKRYNYNWAN